MVIVSSSPSLLIVSAASSFASVWMLVSTSVVSVAGGGVIEARPPSNDADNVEENTDSVHVVTIAFAALVCHVLVRF